MGNDIILHEVDAKLISNIINEMRDDGSQINVIKN